MVPGWRRGQFCPSSWPPIRPGEASGSETRVMWRSPCLFGAPLGCRGYLFDTPQVAYAGGLLRRRPLQAIWAARGRNRVFGRASGGRPPASAAPTGHLGRQRAEPGVREGFRRAASWVGGPYGPSGSSESGAGHSGDLGSTEGKVQVARDQCAACRGKREVSGRDGMRS